MYLQGFQEERWCGQNKGITKAETWVVDGLGFRSQLIIYSLWGFGNVWTSIFTSVKWRSYLYSIRLWGRLNDTTCTQCFVLCLVHTWVKDTTSLSCLFKWAKFCESDFMRHQIHFKSQPQQTNPEGPLGADPSLLVTPSGWVQLSHTLCPGLGKI